MKDSRLTTMARRGLTFPAETREQIRKTGIRCRPQLEIVYQQRANEWKLRGEESGGAVADLGHYVGFVGKDGETLPWLQRVQNFLPNGVHAVVVEAALDPSGNVSLRANLRPVDHASLAGGYGAKAPRAEEPNSLSGAQRHARNGAVGQRRSVSRWRHASLLYSKRRTGPAGCSLDRGDPQGHRGGLLHRLPPLHLLEAGTVKHALEVPA